MTEEEKAALLERLNSDDLTTRLLASAEVLKASNRAKDQLERGELGATCWIYMNSGQAFTAAGPADENWVKICKEQEQYNNCGWVTLRLTRLLNPDAGAESPIVIDDVRVRVDAIVGVG